MSEPDADEVMRRLSSDNPRSREHREERSDGWSFWRCIPIRDAVEARAALDGDWYPPRPPKKIETGPVWPRCPVCHERVWSLPRHTETACSCGPWVVEGDPRFRTSKGSWHKGSCPLHVPYLAPAVTETADLRDALERIARMGTSEAANYAAAEARAALAGTTDR